MDKNEICVDYAESGVKTLRVLSIVFFALTALVVICMLYAMGEGDLNAFDDIGFCLLYIGGALSSLGFGALLLGVSTIAKTALYKRSILESDYVFKPVAKKK